MEILLGNKVFHIVGPRIKLTANWWRRIWIVNMRRAEIARRWRLLELLALLGPYSTVSLEPVMFWEIRGEVGFIGDIFCSLNA